MSELSIQTNILKAFRKRPGYWIKIRQSLAGENSISDLIGCVPTTITAEMVGKKVGLFVAIEIKKPGETPEPGQFSFLKIIKMAAGISGWATSTKEALKILEGIE